MDIYLDWQICKDGYELIKEPNSSEYAIQPKSEKMIKYNPLINHSALLNQLAGISTKRGFLQFAGYNGLLTNPKKAESITLWHNTAIEMKKIIEQHDLNNFNYFLKLFNNSKENIHNFELDSLTKPVKLVAKVKSLKQALLWQFARAITLGYSFERCSLCFTWFAVGQGTGRRKRAEKTKNSFCSPQHQGRYMYNKKRHKNLRQYAI